MFFVAPRTVVSLRYNVGILVIYLMMVKVSSLLLIVLFCCIYLQVCIYYFRYKYLIYELFVMSFSK